MELLSETIIINDVKEIFNRGMLYVLDKFKNRCDENNNSFNFKNYVF